MATQQSPGRPRTKSRLSFGSTRSRRSSGSIGKLELTESPKEKSARRMTSKANPTTAMTEAQPAAQALEQSTLESIRSIQHRDVHGNLITDPDRSNPTRPRLERPLDTIRSFEAAIDGSYSKRFSTRQVTQDFTSAQSRRSSYYQGFNNSSPQQRFPGDGGAHYNNNRMSYSRPASYVDPNTNLPGPPNQVRRFGPRNSSDPALYGQNSQGVYPTNGYHNSYDTVTSASGTGSHATDQWGNSTDPSSENSSIDKIQQVPKPEPIDNYGLNGFGGSPQFQGPILEEYSHGAPAYGRPGYGRPNQSNGQGYQRNGMPPPPPPHAPPKDTAPRVPMKLGKPAQQLPIVNGNSPRADPEQGEKRKSWLKRRFSKNG